MRQIAWRICLLMMLGACDNRDVVPPPPQDSWYRALEAGHEFHPLPLFLYSPVREELVDEAVAALGEGPLLQLSTNEAHRYATDELRTVREFRPFLIHGLYRREREFTVYIADRALWVNSKDDPADTMPVVRQPLVIYIDETPPNVFVTVGVNSGDGSTGE